MLVLQNSVNVSLDFIRFFTDTQFSSVLQSQLRPPWFLFCTFSTTDSWFSAYGTHFYRHALVGWGLFAVNPPVIVAVFSTMVLWLLSSGQDWYPVFQSLLQQRHIVACWFLRYLLFVFGPLLLLQPGAPLLFFLLQFPQCRASTLSWSWLSLISFSLFQITSWSSDICWGASWHHSLCSWASYAVCESSSFAVHGRYHR